MKAHDVGAAVRATSVEQWAVRAVLPLGTVLVLASATAASGVFFAFPAACVVVLAVAAAVRPDTHLPLGTMAALAVGWLAVVDRPATPWVLPAAAGLLAVHVGAALAASAPSSAALPAPVLRRWLRGGALVLPAAVPVWLVAVLATGADLAGTTAALAAVAVGAALAAAWLARA